MTTNTFKRGDLVTVRRAATDANHGNVEGPDFVWDSKVYSFTVHGDVWVTDEYNYPYRVSPDHLAHR